LNIHEQPGFVYESPTRAGGKRRRSAHSFVQIVARGQPSGGAEVHFAGCRPELRDRRRAVDGPLIEKFDDQVNTLT
jgi:hypothetical protein